LQKELAQVTYALEKWRDDVERYGYSYQLLYNLSVKEKANLKWQIYKKDKELSELSNKGTLKNYSRRFWTDLLAIF